MADDTGVAWLETSADVLKAPIEPVPLRFAVTSEKPGFRELDGDTSARGPESRGGIASSGTHLSNARFIRSGERRKLSAIDAAPLVKWAAAIAPICSL